MAATRQTTAQNLHASASPSITFTGWTPAEDDLVLLFCHTTNTTTVNTVPGDWTDVLGGLVTPGDTTAYLGVFYHWVTAGEESAATLTYTIGSLWATSETNMVMGVVYRDANTSTPIGGFGTGSNAGNTTAHELPAISGTGLPADCVVVSSVSADGAATYTTPGGWTQRQTQTASDPGAWAGERDTLTSAGVGVSATTITSSLSGEYVAASVAVAPAAGGGPVDLVVADLTVTVTVDAPTLTQVHQLVVEDMTVAASVDSVVLTQVHVLAVADLTVGSSIDGLTLTQVHVLTVEDLTVGSSIDTVTLEVGGINLDVADLTVTTTIDTVTLTQVHVLDVSDCTVASSIDTVALTQVHTLTVADLTLAVSIGSVTLTVGELEPSFTGEPLTTVIVTVARTATVQTPARTATLSTPERTTSG